MYVWSELCRDYSSFCFWNMSQQWTSNNRFADWSSRGQYICRVTHHLGLKRKKPGTMKETQSETNQQRSAHIGMWDLGEHFFGLLILAHMFPFFNMRKLHQCIWSLTAWVQAKSMTLTKETKLAQILDQLTRVTPSLESSSSASRSKIFPSTGDSSIYQKK